MKPIYILVLLPFMWVTSFSQECRDYWNQNGVRVVNNSYSIVANACMSKLLATDETMEIPFELFQCKDYKLSIFSSLQQKAFITLYDKNSGELIYKNTLSDTAQVIEFQMKENRSVLASISLPNIHAKKVVGAFTAKPDRYCVGIKLESMITRR